MLALPVEAEACGGLTGKTKLLFFPFPADEGGGGSSNDNSEGGGKEKSSSKSEGGGPSESIVLGDGLCFDEQMI